MLSVSATVLPACAVQRSSSTSHRAEVACSSGTGFSTMTAARHDERPLAEASEMLGAPVLRGRRIAFTRPMQVANAAGAISEPAGTRYLTITY